MKAIVLRLDRYSKIVLTIIAIALILIALKPFLPTDLQANPKTVEAVDINIAEVGGYSVYGSRVNVKVTNPEEIGAAVGLWLGY